MKATKLDPNYQKAQQRLAECLIRCARPGEAVKIADHLFMGEQTTKNRELLNEAKRAADLIESENNFGTMVYNAGKKMLVLTAQAVKVVTDFDFPIVSSKDRQADTKRFDEYEIELCKMV